jgi:hypothetical protein
MLEPSNRQLLLESLQPPSGSHLSWAVGTTYTLDLTALLSAPVAFAFSDCQDREGRPIAEPLALLKAVRQYARDICLFCQGGQIKVPRNYMPLLVSLEESIVEASAPRGGSFHPKIWLLRFVQSDGDVLYRVLCLSRNLTFDRSWDTMLRLDGLYKDRANAYTRNHPLGRFVESLPHCAKRVLAPRWQERFVQMAHELRRVDFEVPEPFDEMRFWPLNVDSTSSLPFPRRRERMLVISPFVDDGMANILSSSTSQIELVSRSDVLDTLQTTTQERYSKLWILDDGADTEAGAIESETEPAVVETTGVSTQPLEAAQPLTGLHAKLYVVDQGWNASIWTGSANATRAGFEQNVEFLIELQGKKSKCGVAAILGEPTENAKRVPTSLAQLLQPFKPNAAGTTLDPIVKTFEREVDKLARELSSLMPVANCQAIADTDAFSVTVHCSKDLEQAIIPDWHLRARPISLPAAQFIDVDLSQENWVEFAPLSLLGLTSFFVFDVASSAVGLSRQFVLNIPLVDAPTNRQERVLHDLLSDKDRVLRFLLLLLIDVEPHDLSGLFGESHNGKGAASFLQSLFGASLFESLMRALERNGERLDQVADLIQDLQHTTDGKALLPDGFDAIWNPIWEARCRRRERISRRSSTN